MRARVQRRTATEFRINQVNFSLLEISSAWSECSQAFFCARQYQSRSRTSSPQQNVIPAAERHPRESGDDVQIGNRKAPGLAGLYGGE